MSKKQKTLNSSTKSLMIANGYKYVDAAHAKDFIKSMKAEYNKICEILNVHGAPSAPIKMSPTTYARLNENIGNIDKDTQYMYFVKALILGYWVGHKIIYRIPQETVKFITEQFDVRYINHNINRIVNTLCEEPIYVEIEGGCNYFCGTCSFPYHKFGNITVGNLPLIAMMIDKNQFCHYISQFQNAPVKGYFDDIENGFAASDPRFNILIKVLAYIDYAQNKKDSIGNVLIADTSKPYVQTIVQPNPFTESIPDLNNPAGWIPVGLCNAMHYLSRQNMLDNFNQNVRDELVDNIFEFKENDELTMDREQIQKLLQWSVLQWESCKVVYQYESNTIESLMKKYDMIDIGRHPELLRYMPYPVIALSNHDVGQISLACVCRFKLPNQQIYNGLLIYCSIDQQDIFGFFPFGVPDEYLYAYICSNVEQYNDTLNDAFFAIAHILTVMKQKEQKRIAKGLQTKGTLPTMLSTGETESHAKDLDKSDVYKGYDIEGEDFVLNDITVRTVKRVTRKEAETRVGWHMRPHIRRGHPHRFWVGSGEDRHLETRILQPMQVNCSESGPDKPTIHKIKG